VAATSHDDFPACTQSPVAELMDPTATVIAKAQAEQKLREHGHQRIPRCAEQASAMEPFSFHASTSADRTSSSALIVVVLIP